MKPIDGPMVDGITPGADAPVPPDLLAHWSDGLGAAEAAAATDIPANLTERRPRADRFGVRTMGDVASFSIQQEAAIGVCEAQRDEAVQIVRDQNAAAAALARPTALKP